MKPTLNEADVLFRRFPDKTLREWANDWEMSHENVRLMKIKLGLPTTKKVSYNPEIARQIVEFIREGKGTLNTSRTYEHYNFGKVTFLNWMKENPSLATEVKIAEQQAMDKKLNPTHKRCATTGEWLPVSEFYKDKNTLDGYSVRSKKVVKEMARKYYYKRNVSEPTVDKKICSGVPELGPISSEYFAKNTRSATGLQTYSKKFQGLYQKNLRQSESSNDAFNMAKQETLSYFKDLGITPK